jgi:integrase
VQWSEREWDPLTQAERRKVKTQFFPTAETREARAVELRKQRREGRLRTASRGELDQWEAFKAACDGVPWADVVAGWRAWRQTTGLEPCKLDIKTAADGYLQHFAALVDREQRSPATEKKVALILKRFAEAFGPHRLDQVNGQQIEDWIDGLEEVEADETFNTYLKTLNAFFAYHTERAIIRDNPCALISRRDDLDEHRDILSVEATAQLFHTALTFFEPAHGRKFRRLIAGLSLEAFGGLRVSSVIRMSKEDISVVDRGILHPKRKLKTRRRHYVDGFPDNLWEWLKLTAGDSWGWTVGEYDKLKSELFAPAGVPHPYNCLRHGFASYHLASFKNPGLTAYLLCHRNQDQLWDTYKGNAKEADGKRFWLLTPASVGAAAAEWIQAQPIADTQAPSVDGHPQSTATPI